MAAFDLATQWQLAVVLLLTLVALVFFVTELLPLEITALGIPVVLAITGILGPLDAFSGFSNTATLTVLMMFILSAGIVQSGVIDWLADRLGFMEGTGVAFQILFISLLAGILSAFINNTAAVAVLIPLVLHIANRSSISPSKVLIPLSFAAMLGGSITLIGSSTNLLASTLRQEADYGQFGMFEFAHAGFVLFAIGTVFLFLTSRWLLPARVEARRIDDRYQLREFLVEAVVPEDSSIIGKRVGEAALSESYEAEVLQISREGFAHKPEPSLMVWHAGDHVLLRATRANIQRMVDTGIVHLQAATQDPMDGLHDFDFAELLIAADSPLRGRRVSDLGLWRQHRVHAVAILSRGRRHVKALRGWRLRIGDVLLVVGVPAATKALAGGEEFHVLGGPDVPLRRPHKVPHALIILGAVVALAAFGVAHIVVLSTGGAVLMVALGVLRVDEMYRNIRWDVIFLLAGIIPLGLALDTTGATDLAADALLSTSGSVSPLLLLGIIYVATAALTNLVSNNAAVVLLVPVCIEVAERLGLSPTPFVLAAMFAASNAYLTPIGYQTNLLVMGPGGYKYWDYARLGIPLTIILAVATPLVLNRFWPVV